MVDTRKSFLISAALLIALMLLVGPLHAQSLTVLHNFTGGADGGQPTAGLTFDAAGNLYGTTSLGGVAGACEGNGCGVIFKLTRKNSAWTLNPLYVFTGGSDGAWPFGRVLIGPDGSVYGTAILGGNDPFPDGTGVVFNLRPPSHISSRVLMPWDETVIYTFGLAPDGNYPSGDLIFDAAGNVYGTTQSGGYECEDTVYCGVVYELTHSGGVWTESILYAFENGNVAFPYSGVVFDQVGNLYGTTTDNSGAVFQLTRSGSSWALHDIYNFGAQGDASLSIGGLVFDALGNLYGGTESGGADGAGAVYELMPLGGSWVESVIYSLPGNGYGPQSTLAKDAAGNLYGTSCTDGSHNSGTVFKLTPSDGVWTPTTLYEFTGGSDGYCPSGTLIVDGSGNIYGTTVQGGANGEGTIWEITP